MARLEDVRVGAFVLIAVLAAIGVSLWILGAGLLGGTPNRYFIEMPRSGGVQAGDRVRVAGVASGRVESLELRPGESLPVRFEVSLAEKIQLYEDAYAYLASDGLLGSSYIELEPGDRNSQALEPGAVVAGRETGSIEGVYEQLEALAETANSTLGRIETLATNLDEALGPLLTQLTELMSDENVDSIGGALAGVDAMIAELRPRLVALVERSDALLADLQEGTGSLPEVSDELLALTRDLRTAIGEDGRALTEVLETARRTLESYDAGEGEMSTTLQELAAVLENLEALTDDLRDRPSSLIGLRPLPDRRPGDGTPRKPREERP